MRKASTWLVAIAVLVALGLFAGCGDDDSSSSSTPAATSTSEDSSGGSDDTASSGATPDDVYNACLDAIAGTPAESAGQAGCQAAKDAFEQCTQQASDLGGSEADTAVAACQDAADKATDALKAGG